MIVKDFKTFVNEDNSEEPAINIQYHIVHLAKSGQINSENTGRVLLYTRSKPIRAELTFNGLMTEILPVRYTMAELGMLEPNAYTKQKETDVIHELKDNIIAQLLESGAKYMYLEYLNYDHSTYLINLESKESVTITFYHLQAEIRRALSK